MDRCFSKILLILLLLLSFSGCERDNSKENVNEVKNAEGYIVGFDPCTIDSPYRIGYIIISTDLKDTLVTYNISDSINKMPANVFLNKADTLYRIPWEYFQNYVSSSYLPESVRDDYRVKISYIKTPKNEMVYPMCLGIINLSQFHKQIEHNQVIVKSLSKY